jgi:hypothetical protein
MSAYLPSEARYQTMRYNRCGRSGLRLPAISLGLWHNFTSTWPTTTGRRRDRPRSPSARSSAATWRPIATS